MNKFAVSVAALAFVIGSAGFAVAQDKDRGRSEGFPGQEMHEHGSVPGSPGASGYSRGHQDRDDRGTLRDRGDRGNEFDRDVK